MFLHIATLVVFTITTNARMYQTYPWYPQYPSKSLQEFPFSLFNCDHTQCTGSSDQEESVESIIKRVHGSFPIRMKRQYTVLPSLPFSTIIRQID